MGRWEPNARGRLERAAMELYVERGFEQTTVTEVAERAGLTQRTFFRHFADKREVLFAGSAMFQKLIVDHVAAAPEAVAPIDSVVGAIKAAGAYIQEGGDRARLRQTVIAANPELQERELIKMASIASAIAGTLRERGVLEPAASLTAEAGIAVLKVGFERWIGEGGGDQGLPEALQDALDQLRAVTAGG